MLRTPIIGALRAAQPSNRFVRAALIPCVSRTFTTTVPRCDPGNKVIFDKTSNAELDDVFTTMLHKIILPARLPKSKRRLLASAENAQKLETDPIIIEVEDYEHQFGTLDYRTQDIPASWPLFRKAMDLMRTREDWANLVRLLKGYTEARRKFNNTNVWLIIHCAGKTGNIYAVIDALRRSKECGLVIQKVPRADYLLYWVQRHAMDSGFAPKETQQAKTWALMLHDMMQEEAHAKHPSSAKAAKYPLHREPHVVGQVLSAVASQAALHQGGQDTDGKVAELAELLAHLWPQGANLAAIHRLAPADSSGSARIHFMRHSDGYLGLDYTSRIAVASSILHGVRLARKIVEPGLAARLEPIERLMEADLAPYRERKAETNARKGWDFHDKLFPEVA